MNFTYVRDMNMDVGDNIICIGEKQLWEVLKCKGSIGK